MDKKMKLSIELDDAALQKAVGDQVGKQLSLMAETEIKTILEGILNLKIDRLGDSIFISRTIERRVDELCKERVTRAINDAFGASQIQRKEFVQGMISQQVARVLK